MGEKVQKKGIQKKEVQEKKARAKKVRTVKIQTKKAQADKTRTKKTRKGESAPVLRLKGELSIAQAGELKEALAGALKKPGRLDVDVRDVTAVDIPCVQLFFSAHRTARRKKKTVVLLGASDALREMIASYGFKLDRAEGEKAGETCIHLA